MEEIPEATAFRDCGLRIQPSFWISAAQLVDLADRVSMGFAAPSWFQAEVAETARQGLA